MSSFSKNQVLPQVSLLTCLPPTLPRYLLQTQLPLDPAPDEWERPEALPFKAPTWWLCSC